MSKEVIELKSQLRSRQAQHERETRKLRRGKQENLEAREDCKVKLLDAQRARELAVVSSDIFLLLGNYFHFQCRFCQSQLENKISSLQRRNKELKVFTRFCF